MTRWLPTALFTALATLAALTLARALWVPDPAGQAEAAFAAAVAEADPNRLHGAATAWREVLAHSPGDPFAWTGLAWTEALRGAPPAYVDRLMARGQALAPEVPALATARARWRTQGRTGGDQQPPGMPER
ncbi:hypothetical protein HNR56_001419 [Roseospira marina]|nr:hypothetical protein [Roseospira marina]MBB5086732.1 hypothetical protein [Roseospira marina]